MQVPVVHDYILIQGKITLLDIDELKGKTKYSNL